MESYFREDRKETGRMEMNLLIQGGRVTLVKSTLSN